jgi:23S rRNA pseudouridine1911/1915/1917 synthase
MNGIKIIYEDDSLLVLDKPWGITVNRAESEKGKTVQDWVEENGRVNLENADRESDFYKRSGIVHRIDKETSGILLAAKNPTSFENLQGQFKERTVKKHYLALVHGKISGEGEIKVPVGRLPWARTKFGVLSGGRDAITRYRSVSSHDLEKEPLTLLELYPETGRTHQIRVHLKYINHPIFGDPLYAGRKTARNDRKILGRLFLHAHKISFLHPKTGKRVDFTSPLPPQLAEILE